MILVKATREGLEGETTASGFVIDKNVPFVALPSRSALGRFVYLRNPLNNKSAIAWVGDIGPHFTNDDDYVLRGKRPKAESIAGMNKAGIDLGERIWNELGMEDNTNIYWQFITTEVTQVAT